MTLFVFDQNLADYVLWT